MKNQEKLHTELRSGYTTGTCAAAVAKASAYMLLHQKKIEHVSVTLPNGSDVYIELNHLRFDTSCAFSSTIKDAGDDPDITHGIEIQAEARLLPNHEIKITAGKGIGRATKPGLAVKVGEPAINPVPQKMIYEAVKEILPENTGIEILLCIPEGAEIAKKTFNPKLGIVDGISILGTTGIVKPMSEEALKDSLVLKLKQLAAFGITAAVFSPGNYGKAFSHEQFNYEEDKIVLTSNYIGFMLEQAVRNNFRRIILIGHIGKLVKLAGGIFQTHSRVADARKEVLASHYLMFSQDVSVFHKIMEANTLEETTDFIPETDFWNYLATTIKTRAEEFIYKELSIEVILFSQKKRMVGSTSEAIKYMEELTNE